jgi:hypothetical protein
MPLTSAPLHPRPSMAACPESAHANAHHRTTMRYNSASQTVQMPRKLKFMSSLSVKSFINNSLHDPLPKLTLIESGAWSKMGTFFISAICNHLVACFHAPHPP